MGYFYRKNGVLWCEGVEVEDIAYKYGTPLYLYSSSFIRDRFIEYKESFSWISSKICYSIKANSNISICSMLARLGAGADVVSGGEIYRALKAGFNPQDIVFAGVGKREEEIRYALENGILLINVESYPELLLLNSIAMEMGIKARAGIRINPALDTELHPHVSTGARDSKFGIELEFAEEVIKLAAREMEGLEVIGLHIHIGSQITEVDPFIEGTEKLLGLFRRLKAGGVDIRYLDVGGGLGIDYGNDDGLPSPSMLSDVLRPLLSGIGGVTVILEPGRSIVGKGGILLTKVLYVKKTPVKDFVIVDAGMNDFIRPSLYGSYHRIIPVREREGKRIKADVVGPVCESGDFLGKGREMVEPEPGDILAVMDAGAYGFTMSSNYNSRPRPAEVMVKGSEVFLIREREGYEDLIDKERMVEL